MPLYIPHQQKQLPAALNDFVTTMYMPNLIVFIAPIMTIPVLVHSSVPIWSAITVCIIIPTHHSVLTRATVTDYVLYIPVVIYGQL